MPTPTRFLVTLFGFTLILLFTASQPGLAQGIQLVPADTSSSITAQPCLCLKPWSIADRWDDEYPIPGYPEWSGNGTYDYEAYTDQNKNGRWDWYEQYHDRNGDGVYNTEYYDPRFTGYTAASDLGRPLHLSFNRSRGSDGIPAYALFPPAGAHGAGSPAQAYKCYISNSSCGLSYLGAEILTGVVAGLTRQAVNELLARDPYAYWDDDCQCIMGSDFEFSPRLGLLPMYNPRFTHQGSRHAPPMVKIGGIFVEDVDIRGNVWVRLVPIPSAPSELEWFLPETGLEPQDEPDQRESTWGRIKADRR